MPYTSPDAKPSPAPPSTHPSQAPTNTQPSEYSGSGSGLPLRPKPYFTGEALPPEQAEAIWAVLDQQTPKVQAAERVLPGEQNVREARAAQKVIERLVADAKRIKVSVKPPQAPKVQPTERVQASYKQLAVAATNLNTASDELGRMVGILEKALKKLNLGISAWVAISKGDSHGTEWWSRDIGYGKVGGKWGIALRTIAGSIQHPDEDSEEAWLFNEAPRWMRVEAIGKIPDLLDRLVKQTEETTQSIRKKTTEVSEFAQAIDNLAEESESIDKLVEEPMNWDDADAEQK
jgi:hypothetical protein